MTKRGRIRRFLIRANKRKIVRQDEMDRWLRFLKDSPRNNWWIFATVASFEKYGRAHAQVRPFEDETDAGLHRESLEA